MLIFVKGARYQEQQEIIPHQIYRVVLYFVGGSVTKIRFLRKKKTDLSIPTRICRKLFSNVYLFKNIISIFIMNT